MVSSLLLISLVLLLLAAALFLWFTPEVINQRKAAARHAESILQSSNPSSMEVSSTRYANVRSWQDLLLRSDLPAIPRTLLLLAAPTVAGGLFAGLRTQSWIFAFFAMLFIAIVTAAWIYRRIVRLQRDVIAQLPDFLEHMVRIAAVGNSLPMAFQGAAGHTKHPLKPIIDQAQRNTRAGMDIDRALHQAAQSFHIQPLEIVALILGTSMRIGGRSDQIVQRMADFMRDQEQAQRELNATTSETRMSAIVLGLLPLGCGFLMAMTNPDFFNPMFEQPLGKKIMILALTLELIGAGLLWRLSRSL